MSVRSATAVPTPVAVDELQRCCKEEWDLHRHVITERCDWIERITDPSSAFQLGYLSVDPATGELRRHSLHSDTRELIRKEKRVIAAYLSLRCADHVLSPAEYTDGVVAQVMRESQQFAASIRERRHDTIYDLLVKGEVSQETFREWMSGHETAPSVFDEMNGLECYLDFFRPLQSTPISYGAFRILYLGECQSVFNAVIEEMDRKVGDEVRDSEECYDYEDQ
jgi:hypothetical protein